MLLENALIELEKAVQHVFSTKSKHLRLLPYAVRDLSILLTQQRASMQHYWAEPKYSMAYCYYFLPWNIVRLAHLFDRTIDIFHTLQPLSTKSNEKQDSVIQKTSEQVAQWSENAGIAMLDIGSGPLTIPIALWLLYEELREYPLHWYCADLNPTIVRIGENILRTLAQKELQWRITHIDARKTLCLEHVPPAQVVFAGNVFNEIVQHARGNAYDVLARVVSPICKKVKEDGFFLCVEPGNRFGGKVQQMLRTLLLQNKYKVRYPCTHQQACPYLTSHAKTWCHIRFEIPMISPMLQSLTRKVHSARKDVSYCVLVAQKNISRSMQDEREYARVISSPFYISDYHKQCAYICMQEGIALCCMQHSKVGEKLRRRALKKVGSDKKTGCPIFIQQ